MIRTLTVDFWNTLFDSAGGEHRNAQRRDVLLEAIRRAGHQCGDELFDRTYKGIWEYFDEHWLERQRTPTSREMIDEMLRRLEYSLDERAINEVVEVFARGVLAHPPAMLPGVADALEELHDRGIALAVISDTAFSPGVVLRELMEREGIARYFRTFVFSDETGVAKPHPEAFRRALEGVAVNGSRVDPSSACHIGDIERTDIKGAKAVGMNAVLYRGGTVESKYAEESTQADATITHWSEMVAVIDGLSAHRS